VCSLLTVLALGTSGCDREVPLAAGPPPPQAVQQSRDSALAPNADTYIRQGNPNQNQGAELILRLQASGKNRALVRWDPQAIGGAISGDSLVAARLELTIATNADNWGTTGRAVDLHRLTQTWAETGATWNCADDTNPANSAADCAGATAWAMDGPDPRPWATTPTATRLITNGLRGVVTFDVTADVRAVSSGGGAQHGWILKKTDDGASGHVEFGSRESGSSPRLVLTLVSADTARPPVPAELNLPLDSTITVPRPGDPRFLYFRNIVGIAFDDTSGGATIRAVLSKYDGVIIGGAPHRGPSGAYIVQVPDPGPTFGAVDSLVTRIALEPGVDYAYMVTRREARGIRSRFPHDGPLARRVNWFDSVSDATRSRLAIRAPLAWGCETGTYTVERVRVGVIDDVFAPLHNDLVATRSTPTGPLAFDSLLTIPALHSHGTGVAGILAATGDNGGGVAGMMWGADLRLFAYGRRDSLVANRVDRFLVMVREATAQRVRVLSTSIAVGDPADTIQVRDIREALRTYLTSGNGNVFVLAIGNDFLRLPAQQVDSFGPPLFAIDRAAVQLFNAFPNQVFLVAGTDTLGALAAFSNFWTGATTIAAPAEGILTLGDPVDFPDSTQVVDGTSFAAPFVAGVAGQLLAMDSTLTGAQIGDYIVRGSREPRLSPQTGQLQPPAVVAGAPGPIHQLDAYGALALLSREHPNTPICGFPVSVDGFNGNAVRPEAPGRMPLPVAGASAVLAVSVAQGGRLMAVVAPTAGSGPVRLLDHHGNQLGTLAQNVLERRYLERDTLDVSLQSRTTPCGVKTATVLTRRGPSGTSTLEPIARVAPTGLELLSEFATRVTAASPAGDRVVIAGRYAFGPNCEDSAATVQNRMDVMTFDSTASMITVANFEFGSGPDPCGGVACPALDQPGAWSHDGRRVLLPLVHLLQAEGGGPVTGVNTLLVRFLDLAGPDTTTIPSRGLLHPGFSADDSVAFFAEFDQVDQGGSATNCSLTRRRAADATLLTTGPADLALCQFGGPGPGKIFNVLAGVVAAGAQPADGARVARGTRSPLARPGGPRRVQAN